MNATIKISGLGTGIKESIFERSKIDTSIYNVKQEIKYVKMCKKEFKEHPDFDAILNGALHNLNHRYENELLPVKKLADKYRELWGNKYYKTLLDAERLLKI